MSQTSDFWFVRLPDGRILRAASTRIVRQELGAGRIPPDSTVRRSPNEEWVALEWTREFSDLIERRSGDTPSPEPAGRRSPDSAAGRPSTVASRLEPERLHLVGVGALLQELLAALDSTLVPQKLLVALTAGLALGALATVVEIQVLDLGSRALNVAASLGALLVIVSVPMGFLTRATYVELSQLRSARWQEGFAGLGLLALRLAVAIGVVAGALWGLIVLVRWLPVWILPAPDASGGWAGEAAAGAVLAAGVVLEVGLWGVLGVSGLVAPLLVVEDCPIGRGLFRWVALLREHLGRIFLFEALALGIGLVLAVPCAALLVPLQWLYVDPRLALAFVCVRNLLAGLAVGLLLAYVLVANVFIYLHLRYATARR
jgi:hypothetical protein